MACELEADWRRKRKKAVCVVAPADNPHTADDAAAVTEILYDE
jgi:hypothetical protein